MKEVVIIGGGLAGLVSAGLLVKEGFQVRLIEEKTYPFHRVCGEYISNEVKDFLLRNELYPIDIEAAEISQFKLTAISGKMLQMPLDLGGFGISRYAFDYWLIQKLQRLGVELIKGRVVSSVFQENAFLLSLKSGEIIKADLVVGAFGKRSMLDRSLSRPFLQKRSPYIGVKYHIRTEKIDSNIVELHNFEGGYCGVNKVENDRFNLCYLSHRENLKKHRDIPQMEQDILHKNPHLQKIFKEAEFLFEAPEVINEITFEKKEPVFDHILMAGDAAGMITPLCGNGMAMAIHSAKIISEAIVSYKRLEDRAKMERDYEKVWNKRFSQRLSAGRAIQKLFGAPISSELAVSMGRTIKPVARFLMQKTHGVPF